MGVVKVRVSHMALIHECICSTNAIVELRVAARHHLIVADIHLVGVEPLVHPEGSWTRPAAAVTRRPPLSRRRGAVV